MHISPTSAVLDAAQQQNKNREKIQKVEKKDRSFFYDQAGDMIDPRQIRIYFGNESLQIKEDN